MEVLCPLCEKTYESENIKLVEKYDICFFEEHGYAIEVCKECKNIVHENDLSN
jgi:hypothetical protein